MNDNTRNAFASMGLEILKRSVLLVLYEGTDIVYEKSPYRPSIPSALSLWQSFLTFCGFYGRL